MYRPLSWICEVDVLCVRCLCAVKILTGERKSLLVPITNVTKTACRVAKDDVEEESSFGGQRPWDKLPSWASEIEFSVLIAGFLIPILLQE
jgi:hypothetical protein